jgi:hypothetical protein
MQVLSTIRDGSHVYKFPVRGEEFQAWALPEMAHVGRRSNTSTGLDHHWKFLLVWFNAFLRPEKRVCANLSWYVSIWTPFSMEWNHACPPERVFSTLVAQRLWLSVGHKWTWQSCRSFNRICYTFMRRLSRHFETEWSVILRIKRLLCRSRLQRVHLQTAMKSRQ